MKNCSDDNDFNNVEIRFYNNLNMIYYRSYCGTNNEQGLKLFPKYIAVSFDREGIITLDNIERKHEAEMKKWEKFYQAFKKDMES